MIATSYVFDPFIRFSSDAREAYQRVRNSGLYNPRVCGRRSPIPLLALAGILSLPRCGGAKTPLADGVQVTKKGDYIFRVCFTDPYQGAVISTFARNNLQAKTAAQLVDVRNDYSVGLAQAFRESFTKSGGRVVADLKYSEGDSDFSAQITAIRPLDPDVLVVPGYYTDAGLIARQAKALGLRAVLLGGDGWDSPKLTEI